jgi:lysophospholipase L1-like esterase
VGNVQRGLDELLAMKKPEVALIMLGTNDISGKRVPQNYETGLTEIVRKCLDAHCVPILSTIPPRRDHDEAVAEANEIIKKIALSEQIPLVDYHAEIIRRQPDGAWLGTLISDDGVHPTGEKTNVYDEENLQIDGYALRNWLSFLKLREVYFWVLEAED